MKEKLEESINLYCECCQKETKHVVISRFVFDFMRGLLMHLSKGHSLQEDSCLCQCEECGNVVEVELEE